MTNNGWRKPTPELMAAEKYAQVGEGLSIPKSQATTATKRVAAAIGLKAPDLLLLDTFAAFTQAQDWEEGRRPIVWASNNFLIEQTGFSLSALRRHVRRLTQLGLIWIKDSPNGKRYGHRDEDGVIIEAYGFDLAPLAARAQEFEALYAELKQERDFCASLRNVVTVTRRIIRAKIEKALESGLRGPWHELQQEFADMLVMLPKRTTPSHKLLDIVDWFKELKVRVETAFESAFDLNEVVDDKVSDQKHEICMENVSLNNKMIPRDINNGIHILITKQHHLVKSNSFNKKAVETLDDKLDRIEQVEETEEIDFDIEWNSHTNQRSSEVDISLLMMTCPRFGELARASQGYIHNWNDLHRAAGKIRGIAGISEDAWNVAQKVLSPSIAAAAIALVYDKYEAGEVKSPGGYLRGMVEKARVGELHLDRSFYGRMNEHYA